MSVDPEATPAPGNSADPAATATTTVDWEKRYTDTQAAYTQSQQQLAEALRLSDGEDPDSFEALLPKYGYDIEPDEPEPVVGTEPEKDPRLDEFEKFMADQKTREQQNQIQSEWDGWTKHITEKAGVELTGWELKALQVDSIGPDGFPVGPDDAEKILAAYLTERETWLDSQRKTRPRAPHVPAGGQAATGGKDPADMTRQEREKDMLDRLQAETA